MEALGGSAFDSTVAVTKKRRSNTSRRPRSDSHSFFETREISPSSSTPPSDNASKASSDENAGKGAGSNRRELNLNNPSRASFNRAEGESLPKKSKKEDGTYGEFGGFYGNGSCSKGNSSDIRRSSEGVLAPANWKNTNKVNFDSQPRSSEDGNGRHSDARNAGTVTNGSGGKADASSHENKLRKVKLKVGGVTRTIHAKSTTDGASGGSTSKSFRSSDAPRRQKLILQDNSDDELSPPDRAGGLQGVTWKEFSSGNLTSKEGSKVKLLDEGGSLKHADKFSEPVRKSKRVPKRRVLDGALDEEEDEELRYLGRLKTAKVSADHGAEYGDEGDEDAKKRKLSKGSRSQMADGVYDDDVEENGSSQRFIDGKRKSRPEKDSEDTDYIEDEEDLGSDGGPDSKRKKLKKESLDSLADGKKEISLTTRQRALQSGKDGSSGTPENLIEFPNGLPPAPSRKHKEKLSEVEQQLKKAEAAQRRRMQVEKANRESEAEAIRKIRGQDSNRKRKEDKQRKQRDELAKEKAANAAILASNAIRWVIGPTGTVVTFPKDIGLPSIFESKPRSYPPPREKCAGPSCTNTYKYRDSKSKLPLCSLQCYRAVQQTTQPVTTC
ncbi:uncharacterized protein [Aristolochia californica]|uniref:uncharacterized protein n=1 Tax=Aristolochia californica TaxID=171875 RepID=UPI0035DC5D67